MFFSAAYQQLHTCIGALALFIAALLCLKRSTVI